jgi:beta-phosphoglucomutase
MIKAIIFDLDGVLIDATDWHYEALNKALNLFGYMIGRDDHIKIYNGLPTNEKLKMLTEKQGLPAGLHETIKTMKRKYTDDIVSQKCRPDHKKQLMLNHLKNRGYVLACCSNAQKYSVLNMLKMSQLERYFDHILGNDEGFAPKPAPDIYLAVFKKLDITPEEALIIEDAAHGIEAAKNSGAQVIAVRGYDDVHLNLFSNLNLI